MNWNFDEALHYYRDQGAPGDQIALKNLLAEVQTEHGGSIPLWAIRRIADACGIRDSFLLAVIKRSPSLRVDAQGHLLELCAGSGCRARLLDFVERTYGKNPQDFTVKLTPCMHLCGQGPVIRWDGELYCRADEALLRRLLDSAGEAKSDPSEKKSR